MSRQKRPRKGMYRPTFKRASKNLKSSNLIRVADDASGTNRRFRAWRKRKMQIARTSRRINRGE